MTETTEATWEDTYGADLTIAETELWSDNLMGSFDDQDEIWRYEVNEMAKQLLLSIMRGAALGEICDPSYTLEPKKPDELTKGDAALIDAIAWVRDVQLDEPSLPPVDVRRLAVAKIEEAMGEKDVVGWFVFFAYVMARREDPTLSWNDYKERTAWLEAMKTGKAAFELWREFVDKQLEDMASEKVPPQFPLEEEQEADMKEETGGLAVHGV